MDIARIHDVFPELQGELGDAFAGKAQLRSAPKGTVLYEGDTPCPYVPFILSGVVRVFKLGESGREITLYRVKSGQMCVLSASCGAFGVNYSAIAEVDQDVEMVTVPTDEFRNLLERHPSLQKFHNESIASRLVEVMEVLEEVAFRRLDLRLMEHLLKQSEHSGESIETTHVQLAHELGSAREVVSRVLEDLKQHKLVGLERGHITIVDWQGLREHHDRVAGSVGSFPIGRNLHNKKL